MEMIKSLTLQPADMMRLMQSVWTLRAIRIINGLLIVWIAWLLAMLTWGLVNSPEPVATAVPEEAAPVAAQVNPERQLVRQMPNWHLFGEVVQDTTPVARPSVPLDAPDTRLKLILRGAFASADPEYARAIIADPRGKEEMYAAGDQVPGNAELKEIHPDRVILMRGGRFETLRLPRDQQSGSGGGVTINAPSYRTSVNPANRLKSIRQTLKRNPKSLYGLVRTIPKKDAEGKMIGYTLQPGRDPQLFEQMGLQAGDVVTRINDISLDNLTSGVRALKSTQAGENVSLTILRGGQEEVLSFNVPE
jgi:general secretion pathway protein C